MASAVSALIRMAKPAFSSPEERLSFAVHAYIMSSGYKLVAVGAAVDDFKGDATAPEVDAEGFSTGAYCGFRYVAEDSKQPGLLVKCMPMGDTLLVNALPVLVNEAESTKVATAELSMKTHIDMDASTPAGSFRELDELVIGLKPILPDSSSTSTGAATTSKGTDAGTSTNSKSKRDGSKGADGQGARFNPDDDPLRVGPPQRPPHFGGGVPMPMRGGMPGGMPMPGGIGGMHVGPGDPMFMGGGVGPGGRMGGPGMMGGTGLGGMRGGGMGGVPPGARYDPIHGPPGMPGSHPDDYRMDGFHDAGPPPGRGHGFDPYM